MLRIFRGARALSAIPFALAAATMSTPAKATDLDADDYSAGAVPEGTNC